MNEPLEQVGRWTGQGGWNKLSLLLVFGNLQLEFAYVQRSL